MQLADDLAGLQLQRSKQRSGSVAFVIMGASLHLARLQRQQWLRAVERLNLALLVDTKYQGMIRRVHVETYDVAYLLDQQRIRR